VANDRDEMERIGTVTASAPMRQSNLAKSISVFLLPKDKPAIGDQKLVKDYQWSNALEVVPEVMKLATPVRIEWIPAEREFIPTQSFKFTADTGRFLLVTVHRGLKSFGDYPLAKDYSDVIAAPAFPPAVKIISEGSVLSLSGEKKISILTRNVAAIRIEVSRLLPGTVSHLVSQSQGTFSDPTFWRQYGDLGFGFDDLSEVTSEVRQLPAEPSGKNQYSVFDFGPLLSSGALPHGLFWLKIQAWDPVKKEPLEPAAPNFRAWSMLGRRHRRLGQPWLPQPQVTNQNSASDERLILLTDLGLVVKDSADGSHDVFVQSIHSGAPLADVAIDMLGKNGLPIFSRKTNADGRATFPTFKDFKREKTPTVYVAQSAGDFSFLPYQRSDRQLNLSRFDTGGLYTQGETGTLQAFLFSDRGIYRPGEDIHIGMVVKQLDWKPLPDGLPLELVVTDPRGVAIRSHTIKF
jgi:alpha-2-macroglobulin